MESYSEGVPRAPGEEETQTLHETGKDFGGVLTALKS